MKYVGWTVTAMFITAEGSVLNEEAFQRHLAIKFADDRDAVLEEVRADVP